MITTKQRGGAGDSTFAVKVSLVVQAAIFNQLLKKSIIQCDLDPVIAHASRYDPFACVRGEDLHIESPVFSYVLAF